MAEQRPHRPGESGFGAVLRRYREAAMLSQEALAERAGVSNRAVSDLERGARGRPHLETVRLLADALGLVPADRAALAASRLHAPAPNPTTASMEAGASIRRSTLPVPPTPLVMRESEVADVAEQITSGARRLITLTGPGGVGKTRLALTAASDVAPSFPGGAVWIDLAPLAEPALVPTAVAQALGVHEETVQTLIDTLCERLNAERTLLVIDNCEHLRHAVGMLVAHMLAHCSDLQVLATSRAPLRVQAEYLVPIPPLALPPRGADPTPSDGIGIGAIALFVARVGAVRPDFILNDQNAADVYEICRRLDGLPLALELAAARTRILSITALRARLEERLRLLSGTTVDVPARHRTLRDTIAWSYDLLDEEAKSLFRSLAVFTGGATIEAASAVMAIADPFVALDGLEALVDEGLLLRVEDATGELRFRMLETIREFALQKLAELAETGSVSSRHLAYFVRLAEQAEKELAGPDQALWLDRLMADLDNLRGAFGWAIEHQDADAALRLSSTLWRFWTGRGLRRDGTEWLERALALGTEVDPEHRAKALFRLGTFAIDRSDFDDAQRRLEQSLAIRRHLEGQAKIADTLDALGVVASEQGTFDRARPLFDEAFAIRTAHVPDDHRGLALSLFNLAEVTRDEGMYQRASELYEQALEAWSALGDQSTVAYVLRGRGIAFRLAGETSLAAHSTDQALLLFRQLRDDFGIGASLTELGRVALGTEDFETAVSAFEAVLRDPAQSDPASEMVHNSIEAIEGLAWVARKNGEHERAARLLGAATAQRAARHLPFPSYADGVAHAQEVTRYANEIGPSWAAAWESGHLLTLAQALDDAAYPAR